MQLGTTVLCVPPKRDAPYNNTEDIITFREQDIQLPIYGQTYTITGFQIMNGRLCYYLYELEQNVIVNEKASRLCWMADMFIEVDAPIVNVAALPHINTSQIFSDELKLTDKEIAQINAQNL
jgi:hypothetical protein